MSKEDEAGLIVCHPEMVEYLKVHLKEGEEFPPMQIFVITEAIHPKLAFVVNRDEFIDWLESHGQGWGIPGLEKGDN